MNRDDLIRMAREASIAGPNSRIGDDFIVYWGTLENFAHLIASHVAEECAERCDFEAESHRIFGNKHEAAAIENVAESIRSLYKPTA